MKALPPVHGGAAAVFASALPVLLAALLPMTVGEVRSARLLSLLLLCGIMFAAPVAVVATRGGANQHLENAWRVASALLGIALLVVYLAAAVDVPFAHGQLLFLAFLAANVYLGPPGWRLPLGLLVAVAAVGMAAATEQPSPEVLVSYAVLLAGLLLLLLQLRAELDRRMERAAAAATATRVQTELLAALQADAVASRHEAESLLHRSVTALGFDLGVVLRGRTDRGFDIVYASNAVAADLPRYAVDLLDATPENGDGAVQVLIGVDLLELLPAADPGSVRDAWEAPSGPWLSTALLVRFSADADGCPGVVLAGSRDPWDPTVTGAVAGRVLESFGALVCRLEDLERQRAMVDRIDELNRQTQDTVATVSHELRTPLTVIQGALELLVSRWQQLPVEMRRDLLVRLTDNAERLGSITGSLLRSSVDTTGIDPQPRSVRLREHCQATVQRLGELLRTLEVQVDIPPPLEVEADPDLLSTVLENLLVNAAKYTPHRTQVRVSAEHQPGARVRLRIADDGPGIPEQELPFVTEQFYRAGDHLRRDTSGLGLGLSLVKRILRVHGTDLVLTNEHGLVASFTLPAAGSACRAEVGRDGDAGEGSRTNGPAPHSAGLSS